MKTKMFLYMLTVMFTVTNVIANSSDDAKIKARVFENLMGEDDSKSSFPASLQREKIVEILNTYNLEANWGYQKIEQVHLGYFILQNSILVRGSDLRGAIYLVYIDQNGKDVVETTAPDPNTQYLCYKGLPFIQVVKKDFFVVKREMSQPTPIAQPKQIAQNSQKAPEIINVTNPIQKNGQTSNQSTTTTAEDGTIIINNYIYENGSNGQANPSNNTSNAPQYVEYDGGKYTKKNDQWVNFLTGALVGVGMSTFLNNRYNNNTYYSGSNYGGMASYPVYSYGQRSQSYGSNIPGRPYGW